MASPPWARYSSVTAAHGRCVAVGQEGLQVGPCRWALWSATANWSDLLGFSVPPPVTLPQTVLRGSRVGREHAEMGVCCGAPRDRELARLVEPGDCSDRSR